MNIERLYEVINILNMAGMKSVAIEKEDDIMMIRGTGELDGEGVPAIVIISETDSDLVDNSLGINRLPTLTKRINMFDSSKVKIVSDDSDSFTRKMTFKEGRRRVSYTFTNPSVLNIPEDTIEDAIDNTITLTTDYITILSKANQAMNPKVVTISGNNKEVSMSLSDDDGDQYTDVVSTECTGMFSYSWDTRDFFKMIKLAAKYNGTAELLISERGIIFIDVDGLTFILIPRVE